MSARVVAWVPDLMDRSRLSGRGIEFVADARSLAAVEPAPDLTVLDLSRPGAADVAVELATAGRRVVAFAPHVDTELRDRASAAGVEVLARSRFFADPAAVLGPAAP